MTASAPVPQRPEFFVVGGSRCGTTSLHAALARHPELFVPREKSPNFFTAPDFATVPDSAALQAMKGHSISTEREYLALFAQAPPGRRYGEVSPVYLQSVHSAARIADFAPSARIVAILRDPVQRAYAHYIGRRRDGLEPRVTFEEAIAPELADPTTPDVAFNRYLAIGRYAHFLRSFEAVFPREQLLVCLFDDFKVDPRAVVNRVCAFLDVAPMHDAIPMEQRNQGGIIRNPLLRALWTGTALSRARARRFLPTTVRDAVGRVFLRQLDRPPMSPALTARLQAYYHDDLIALETLLDRDLRAWRSAGS